MEFSAFSKTTVNLTKAVVLTALIAMAQPLKAADECDALPELLTEAASSAQIHCALTRAQVQNQARAISIVETSEPVVAESVRFQINFEFGSAELTPASAKLLEKVAKVIAEDEALRQSAFFIDGHTDAVGSDAANQELGLKRAQAAAGDILSNVDFAMTLKVRSFGESALLDASDPTSGQNRRVEIIPVVATAATAN